MVTLAEELFGREQVEKARRYHRPGYAAFVLNTLIGLGALVAVAAVSRKVEIEPWWVASIAIAALAVASPSLARLPVAFLLGYRRERRFGFATQSAGGWLADRAKALAVALALAVPVLMLLVWLGRAFPRWWPVAAVAGAAALILVVSFLAPVVIEPLFNRFEPLDDDQLAGDLRALADRAGVPVRDVLVADASRRTTKVNAYVSGVGRTRRVVVFDTLLEESTPAETKLVVAHELGHRKGRHVLQGTILAMVGAAVAVVVVWAALGPPAPDEIALVLLIGAVLEVLSLPGLTGISRRWERAADRFSLELTRDATVFESTFRTWA